MYKLSYILKPTNMIQRTIMALTIVCLSGSALSGQFQEKTLMVGGNTDFYLSTIAPVSFQLEVHPTFGYFAIDNLIFGVQLDVGFMFQQHYNYSTIGLGPMARYYIGNDNLSFFAHFSYLGRLSHGSYDDVARFSNHYLPGIGMNYMITPSVGLESMLGLYLGEGDPTFSLSFGFQIFLPPTGN